MKAHTRGRSWPAMEALEQRQLLSFDPGKAGAIEHADYSRLASPGADSFYLENKRIGYMAANLDWVLVDTSMSPADPQQYISGARFFFKPLGANPAPFGTVTLRNSEATNIMAGYYWDPSINRFAAVHTDGVWFSNVISAEAANSSIFVFDNVSAREIEGHEAFHFEGGSARRIHFRNTYAHNEVTRGGARYSIKIMPGQVIRELIFENADLNVTDYTRQLDALVFEWNNGTDPQNAAAYLPRIWVKNDGQAAITRAYVIGRLKASGVPEAVAAAIVVDGLPADLSFRRDPLDVGLMPRIQAEDFDYGREGLAYHDTSLANENAGEAEYRRDVPAGDDLAKVDIRQTADVGGGQMVTAVRAGEWMTYTLYVPSSGTYRVDARVQAGAVGGGGSFTIEFDGLTSTGQMSVPADGAWSTQSASVYLSAGVHVMRVAAQSAMSNTGWNINWIELARTGDPIIAWPTGLNAIAEPWGMIRRDAGLPRIAEAWGGQIKLSWNDTPGEDGYIIERSADGVSNWTLVGTNAANQTTFSDTGTKGRTGLGIDRGIQPEQTYYYRIRAITVAGDRVSDVLRVATPAITLTAAPGAPAELTAQLAPASPASGAIELTWKNSGNTAKGFYVERRIAGQTSFTRLAPIGAVAETNTFLDTGAALSPGTCYEYRIIAYNWLGESTPSNVVQINTPDSISPVASPVDFSAVALANGSIRLTWTDNSDNEAAFEIRRASDGLLYAVVPARSGIGQTVTTTLGTLTIPNYFNFLVRAVNIESFADSTSSGSFFVAAQPAPGIGVTELAAFAISNTASRGVELWWPAADELASDVATYKVERSVDGRAWIEVTTIQASQTTSYRFQDEGLSGQTTYYYRVRTNNRSGGTSDPKLSSIVRASTTAFSSSFGGPVPVGGIIQLEDFDRGGEGFAFHDLSATNRGNSSHRRKPDGSGGWILDPLDATADIAADAADTWVSDAEAGEWLRYTVVAKRSGLYQLQIRTRSSGGGTFHLEIDGIDRTGSLTAGQSGDWQLVTVPELALTAGEHVLKLVMDANGLDGRIGDFDWMQLSERVGLYPESGSIVVSGGYDVRITSGTGQAILIGPSNGTERMSVAGDQFRTLLLDGSNARISINLGQVTEGQATVRVIGGSVAFDTSQTLGILSISEMGRIVLKAGGDKTLTLDGLSIAQDSQGAYQGRLDLADNSMIIHATSTRRLRVFNAINDLIRSACSPGRERWIGLGLGSSTAATQSRMGLGVMYGPDGGSIRVKYGWIADANLDGQVDQFDYVKIDTGFLAKSHGYENGDFNYDGVIDAADYFLIDSASILSRPSQPGASQPAPTPGTTPTAVQPSSRWSLQEWLRRKDLEALLA